MSQNMELPNYPRIWLQPFAGDEGSHTWCQDRQSDEDIEYVRADLATSPATEGELVHVDGVTMTPTAAANRIAELEAERDKLREAADNAMNAYVDALVKREHGGIAASIFLAEIAVALGRNPTAEMDAKRREALKAAQ